jgi:histidine triad (HIT) family protein
MTIFAKIIAGEIPCYKVAETIDCLAFLDISPLAKGHILVVPKSEIDYIFDVPDDLLSNLITFAKRVAKAQEQVIPCLRIGVAVIGLEVPHAHIHLIPLNHINDINFSLPKLSITATELQTIAHDISNKYAELFDR